MKSNLKEIWIMIGAIIFGWTLSWFTYVRLFNHYEFIINVAMLIIGYCLLINYLLATVVYLTIKRLKKLHKI